MKKRRKRSVSNEPEPVRRDGGLCAAFVNTVSRKRRAIATYADLLVWSQRHGVLDAAAADRLGRAAAGRPVDAALALHRALELRALLERIFGALVEQRRPDLADVEALNGALEGARRRLVPTAGGYRYAWSYSVENDLEVMLWPILLSATDLLASKYHRRARRCAGRGCDLVFVDRTTGPLRKWCAKDVCGARARARRRYHATIKPLLQGSRRRRAERGSRSVPVESSP